MPEPEDVRSETAGTDVSSERHTMVPTLVEEIMKYMIFCTDRSATTTSWRGSPRSTPGLSPADFAPMYAFMQTYHAELDKSGELVDAQGLAAPAHTRRIQLEQGVPVVTDGPYAETEEVLAGYTLVDCASFDRATEIAAGFAACPYPANAPGAFTVDVRPVMDSAADLEL